MSEPRWGHCRLCKHFASAARLPLDADEAACTQPMLSRYQLRTFGACGCNAFEMRAGIALSREPELTP